MKRKISVLIISVVSLYCAAYALFYRQVYIRDDHTKYVTVSSDTMFDAFTPIGSMEAYFRTNAKVQWEYRAYKTWY